jgi:hypothetical protein
MQVLSLGTDFYVDSIVEGYTSMIWTERFYSAGEFELKTNVILPTMKQLPLGSLLGIAESNECMIVENHAVSTGDDGKTTLTITGRSFETFFENRVARPVDVSDWTVDSAVSMPKPLNANADTSNNWEFDATGFNKSSLVAASIMNYWAQTQDADYSDPKHGQGLGEAIPNFEADGSVAALYGTPVLPNRVMTIKPGNVYENVLALAALDNLGVLNYRPTTVETFGLSPQETKLRTTIEQGHDRLEVVFSTLQGHFRSTSYFWSIKDWKNAAFAFSNTRVSRVYNTSGSTAAGLNRRIGFVDATDLKSSTSTKETGQLTARGNAYLGQHKKVVMFEGQVAPDIPYRFGKDYYIGDYIQVVGDYDFNERMQVTEYVRIEDESGEIAYPSLDLPNTIS